MHQPADIDSELLSLGPREEHAVIQSVEETFIRKPPPFLDQLAVHYRYLTGWTAEGNKPQLHPKTKCLTERYVAPAGWLVIMLGMSFCSAVRTQVCHETGVYHQAG